MSWPIRLYASREAAHAEHGFVPVGAMWPIDSGTTIEQWCEWYAATVCQRYLREHKHLRPPMFVKLPDGTEFCIDFCSSPEIGKGPSGGGGEGWGCSGEPPAITLSPSVHIIGSYHGFIRDGVVTDDCDGRTFPDRVTT